MAHLRAAARSILAAATIVLVTSAPAFATAIFEGDQLYKLSGSFVWGFMGNVTFSDDSTLVYDTNTQKLTVDAKVTSSVYKNQQFNLDLTFGAISYANGAKDITAGPEVDVSFPNGASKATFGILPGPKKIGETMVGTLEATNAFNLYFNPNFVIPAGYDFAVMATGNMSPLIRADNKGLIFEAWLRLWGDKGSAHWDAAGDIHGARLTKIPGGGGGGNPVPEPMSMGLLATGLLGSAITRRKLKKA